MPYTVEFLDATKYEGDAVLNSLGTEGSVYGYLCKNILAAADSENVKFFVDNIHNAEYGRITITEGGKLKCKNIIHVVTPVKKDDDENNSLLKSAYEKVIKCAICRDFKTLGLPFIGTGANGYSESEVYEVLQDVCADIVEEEDNIGKEIINITVIAYLKDVPAYEVKRNIYRERLLKEDYKTMFDGNSNLPGSKYSDSDYFDNQYVSISEDRLYRHIQLTSTLNKSEYFIPRKEDYISGIYKFVEDYILAKGIDERVMVKVGLDRKRKWKLKNEEIKLTKMDVFRISFALNMNRTEVFEFMTMAGFSFSPLEPVDNFYLDYINGKYKKVSNLLMLDYLAYKNNVYMGKEKFSNKQS